MCARETLTRLAAGLAIGLCSPVLLSTRVLAGEWPRFFGPHHDGKVAETDAKAFAQKSGLRKRWEFRKGKGWACPAVVGDRVLVYHRVEDEEVLDCLEVSSGKSMWRYAYAAPYRDRFGSGEGPRTSPVVEGNRVLVFGVTGQLHCVDFESGRCEWSRRVAEDFKMRPNFFGCGSTPLVMDGRVIVEVGGSEDRCVAAFDLASGKDVWVARHAWGASYASPMPMGRDRVLVFAGGESRPATGGLLCIDARSGAVLGEVTHRATIAESVNAASPLVIGNRVFTTEGYGSGGVLSEVAGDGSLREVWRGAKLGSQFITPIHRDGCILGFDGQNARLSELVCVEVESGKEKWRDDLGGKMGRGNLLDLGEAGVLMLGEFGELAWLRIGADGVKVLERQRLWEAPETWTIPVIAGRRLYVTQNERSRDGSQARVICFDF